MALNFKQIVSVGLLLGVLTAFGYHLLTRPSDRVAVSSPSQSLRPIESFDLEPVELPGSVSMPETDSVTSNEFDAIAVKPPSDQLSLNDRMVEPVGSKNDTSDDSEFDLDSLTLEPASDELAFESTDAPSLESSGSSLAEANDVIDELQLESATNGSPESPMAPLEMQPSDTSEPVLATNEVMEQNFESTPALPIVQKGLTNQVQPESQKTEGRDSGSWQSNPFIKTGLSQPTTMQAGHTQNRIANGTTPKQIKTLEELTSNPYASASVSRSETTASSVNQSVPKLNGTQTPANSVTSLIDPNRKAMNQVNEEMPARDFTMPTQPQQQEVAAFQPIPLSDADAQQAVHHIEYGKKLSRRGAGFTAREEFLKALQVLASANDRATGSNEHTRALRKATLIMKEAEDFAVGSAEQQIQMNLANVVESHRSNVLSPQSAGRITTDQAIDRYFSTAQQLLDLAGGRSPVSAEVFYCMGKLNSALPAKQNMKGALEMAKSVVYHQAALMSNPSHHRSANELGVLFAKNGRLQQAKLLFERSLMAKPHPQTWQNLATTHRRLGEHEYARRAVNEFNLLAQRPVDDATINWIGVEQFNTTTETPVAVRTASLPSEGAPTKSANQLTPNSDQKKSLSQRLKDLF